METVASGEDEELKFNVSWEDSTSTFGDLIYGRFGSTYPLCGTVSSKFKGLGSSPFSRDDGNGSGGSRGSGGDTRSRDTGGHPSKPGIKKEITAQESRKRLAERLATNARSTSSPSRSASSNDSDDSNKSTGSSGSGEKYNVGYTSGEQRDAGSRRRKPSADRGEQRGSMTNSHTGGRRNFEQAEGRFKSHQQPEQQSSSDLKRVRSTGTSSESNTKRRSKIEEGRRSPRKRERKEGGSSKSSAALSPTCQSLPEPTKPSVSAPKRQKSEEGNASNQQILLPPFINQPNLFMKNIAFLERFGVTFGHVSSDMCLVQNLMKIQVQSLVENQELRCLRCTKKIKLLEVLKNRNRYKCTCGDTLWYSLCCNMLCSKDIGHRKHCFNCQKCVDDRCQHCDVCDQCYMPSPELGQKCPCIHATRHMVYEDEEACIIS